MTRHLRDLALRKLRQARRLHDAALDHYAAGDEMLAECARLVDEVKELEAGRKPLPRPETGVKPDTRR